MIKAFSNYAFFKHPQNCTASQQYGTWRIAFKKSANSSQHKNIMIKHFLKSLKQPQLTARFFEWMFFRVTVRFQRVTEF